MGSTHSEHLVDFAEATEVPALPAATAMLYSFDSIHSTQIVDFVELNHSRRLSMMAAASMSD